MAPKCYTTPVFKTNIINGLPVVRFTDDILNTSSFDLPASTGGVAIFAVTNSLNAKYAIYSSTANRKFTIAAIPDNQGMTEHANQTASINLFINEIQFIADNIPNMNLHVSAMRS